MKKAILITVVIIAALGAAAYYLSLSQSKQDLSPWQLVPANALAVIETDKPQTIQRLKLDTTGLVETIVGNDSLLGLNTILFTFQSIGNRVGILASTVASNGQIPKLTDQLKKSRSTVTQRSYENTPIYDFAQGGKTWLSTAEVKGVLLISTNGILIEEAIRTAKSDKEISFRNSHEPLFRLSNVKQDDGNLYVDGNQFFSRINPDLPTSGLLTNSMLLDLRWSNNTLLANGFAVDTTNKVSTWLSLFNDQRPVPVHIRNVVPDQFQSLLHFGFSDPATWYAKQHSFCENNNKSILSRLDSIEQKASFWADEFFKGVDNEAALCTMTSGDHLMIIELKEITKSESQLNKLNFAWSKDGNYVHERYSNQDIHYLKNNRLNECLLWPMSFTSPDFYYSIVNNYLVTSDTENGIKRFIDYLDAEGTLNKSLEWSKFLESTLQEANVSYFSNSGNASLFGSMTTPEKFSLQFYTLEGKHYASSVAQFAKGAGKSSRSNRLSGIDFGRNIISPVWTVRNHIDRSTEVLVQDADNAIHLASKEQLWSLNLPGPIQGNVHQVDLLRNGKLQYLFITAGELNVVDRLGRFVAGYPKKIGMTNVSFSALVDYDKSRNYRLAIANNEGKVEVYDLDGKILDGWNPKNLGRDFIDAPRHYKLQQRDYYAAVTIGGDAFVFNRRGDIANGFPMQLKFKPSGHVASDGKSLFIASTDGRLIELNTSGKILREEVLLKKTPQASFSLLASEDRSSFVVIKSEQGSLTGFDSTGKQLFEINNPASENTQFRYYHFANDVDVIVMSDKEQNLSYVFDLNGKMLIPRPVPSTTVPGLAWNANSKTMMLYLADGSRLVNVTIQPR